MLKAENITVSYDGNTVLDHVSFTLPQGNWLMVAGPNGAGKSTLARALAQSISYKGNVLYENIDLSSLKPAQLARKLGMLEQSNHLGYSFTVSEIVRLGRYSYRPTPFSKADDNDEVLIEKALEYTGLTELASRSVLTLSGGELQRVFLAQLFAQDPEILILDEPTNHLDLVYQKGILDLVKRWVNGTNRSVVSVVHDLSLAKAYGDRVLLLSQGKAVAEGTPDEVFSDQHLNDVYGMDVRGFLTSLLNQWE